MLVDRYGVPRARCACGNPLTPATLANPTGYTGDRWAAAFNPAHVVTIAPTPTPMTQLTLNDPVNLAVFTRPVGGNGASDQARTPAPAETSIPTSIPTTSIPVAVPTSTPASAPQTSSSCSYKDAGNGQMITAQKGSTFTDTLGQTYRVGDDCEITHV